MSKEASYFRIGLFIIVATLMLAGALIAFGLGQFFQPKLFIETYVDGTVQGVDIGSAVKFRGVPVGRVVSIGFTFNEYPQQDVDRMTYVSLLMQIDREVFPKMFSSDLGPILARNIERGLRVRIEPQGITGLNYLEINYVDPSRFPPLELRWKPRYYYIPSAPGELTNLLDSVNNIMRETEELNIKGISESLLTLLQNLDKSVTGANLQKLSEDMRKLVADLTDVIKSAKVEEVSADARKLIASLSKSNEELRRILGNVEPASRIDGDAVDATLANIRIISENLRRLSVELERDPSRLIWSRPPKPSKVMRPAKQRRARDVR